MYLLRNSNFILLNLCFTGSCLKIGQHSIFVNIRKIKNNTRILDTLFIDDFTDIMVNIFIIIIIIGNLRN